MVAISDTVVAAILGAVGPILLALVALWKTVTVHFDRTAARLALQNTNEHKVNKEILTGLVETVNKIDGRLDDHFSWHLHSQPNVVQIVRPQDAADMAEGSMK